MGHGPKPLSAALSELIALRGLAASGAAEQLSVAWDEIAGDRIAGRTRVTGVRRGVLEVGVVSAALLHELESFHKPALLRSLQREHAALGIEGLKFRLNGSLANHRGEERSEDA